MSATVSTPGISSPAATSWSPSFTRPATRDLRWSLAFVGLLGYLVIEYARLPMMYPILVPLQLGKVFVSLALVGFLLEPRLSFGGRISTTRTDWAIVAFLFAALLSATFANAQDAAWEVFGYAARWGVLYLLISRTVNSSWRLRIFTFVLLLLNLKLAQFVVRRYLITRGSGRDEMQVMVHGLGAGSDGYFSNSADFGVAMCVVWPIAVSLLFARPKGFWKWLLPASTVVFLGAILVCGSRGAVVGAAAVALASWARSSKKLVAGLMVLLLVAGLIFVFPNASKERMVSAWNWEHDKTASNRVRLWEHGLQMFKDNPLLGVGPGNFAATRGAENLSESVTHSFYVEALSEYGLLGALPLVIMILAVFLMNARTRKHLLSLGPEKRRSFEYCMAAALDLAMIGFLTSGAFVSVLTYPHLWILTALSVGLQSASRNLPPEQESQQPPMAPRALALPGA